MRTIAQWKESLTNHHVEPPWRTPVIKGWSKEVKDEKNKIEAFQWLDEALKWYHWNNLELRKEKIKHPKPRMWYDEPLQKEEIRSHGWNNTNNYIMLILHQFKLMTSNGFGILLILVKRIKIEIAQTWEGLQRTTGRIWKTTNELIQ